MAPRPDVTLRAAGDTVFRPLRPTFTDVCAHSACTGSWLAALAGTWLHGTVYSLGSGAEAVPIYSACLGVIMAHLWRNMCTLWPTPWGLAWLRQSLRRHRSPDLSVFAHSLHTG